MSPEERDPKYLWDMLDSARAVRRYVSGVEWREYAGNRMLRRAVERELEIIGEAARNVSESLKKAHAEVPWVQIVGLRNVLAHEYGEIRQERLWAVATTHVPELISSLEGLAPLPPQEQGR